MKQSSLPFSSIFADEMRQYLELAESADKVTESYYYTFKRLDDFIVKQNYQEKILSADIQYAWINTLDTSSRSRAGEASRLRQFARYLNALGIPAIEIESVRVSSDYVAHNFTDDEIARIIDAADNLISHMNVFVVKEYFPLILRILIGCGMRITEVLELRWTDINLDTGVITVVNAKNKRQRFVPMHQSLTDMLKLYQKRIRRFDKNSFVFENPLDFDNPYGYRVFSHWFNQVLRKANIPHMKRTYRAEGICVHALRHYFAFNSFQKSEKEGRCFYDTAPVLSAYLGHSNFVATTEYITDDYMMYTVSHERMNDGIGSLFPEVSFK